MIDKPQQTQQPRPSVAAEITDKLRKNAHRLTNQFLVICFALLGEECISPTIVRLTINSAGLLLAAMNYEDYPDFILCHVDALPKAFKEAIDNNILDQSDIDYLNDIVNNIPKAFELPDLISFGPLKEDK